MQFKNLILDLDDTLYGYEKPHKLALNSVVDSFSNEFKISKTHTQSSFDQARKNTHDQLPTRAASHNRLLYFQKMLEINGLNSMQYALKYYELYWGVFLEQMSLFENVLPLLEIAKSRGAKVCILTDLTAHIQHRKIIKLCLPAHIDFLVTSEEVGIEKPDRKMFEFALNKLKCKANQALMIGDSWKKDILGANVMGIDSIWINHKNDKKTLPKGVSEAAHFNDIKL